MNGMKIATIICWIVSALVLVGLILWFLTGSMFGNLFGNWNRGWDGFPFGLGRGITENLTGSFTVDGTYTVETEGLDAIKIEWVAGEVTVKAHAGDNIIITEMAQRELRFNEKLRYDTSGHTLTVKFTERGRASMRMPPKRLEVLVPEPFAENLARLHIDSVSGGINIDDLNAPALLHLNTVSGNINVTGAVNDINIDSVSGRIWVTNTHSSSTVNVNTISGHIDLKGDFDRVKIDTVSGSVAVTSAIIPSSFKTNTISGGIHIALPADETISVRHSSVSGKLSSDIPVLMESRGFTFDISTISGSTQITAIGN